MPSTIERVHRELGPRGLTVLAITPEDRELVARWVADRKVTVTVLLDRDGAVWRAYRIAATPTVVLVGRDGTLVGRAIGSRTWAEATGRALLEALLAQ